MNTLLSTEDLELLCRYLKDDLPHFYAELWLSQSDHESLALAYQDWKQTEQNPSQLRQRLRKICPRGQAETWELSHILPWISLEDVRGCRAIERCYEYYQQGYYFLQPIAGAFDEGKTDKGYDWNLLRECVGALKPAAECLFEALAQNSLQLLSSSTYLFTHELAPVFEADLPWREANAQIAQWQKPFQHLIPMELHSDE